MLNSRVERRTTCYRLPSVCQPWARTDVTYVLPVGVESFVREFLKCSRRAKKNGHRKWRVFFFVGMGLKCANAGTISMLLFGWSSVGIAEIKGKGLHRLQHCFNYGATSSRVYWQEGKSLPPPSAFVARRRGKHEKKTCSHNGRNWGQLRAERVVDSWVGQCETSTIRPCYWWPWLRAKMERIYWRWSCRCHKSNSVAVWECQAGMKK